MKPSLSVQTAHRTAVVALASSVMAIVAVALWITPPAFVKASAWVRTNAVSRVDARIAGKPFVLEVAKTPEQHRIGLSGRTDVPSGTGMVFLFDDPGNYAFWMKDTLVPLDILWLRGGKVVDLVTLPATLPGGVPALHRPTAAADRVVELPAGTAAELGVEVGDPIFFSISI
jgi:uncharacterized membrane protein (UPF0127 family)